MIPELRAAEAKGRGREPRAPDGSCAGRGRDLRRRGRLFHAPARTGGSIARCASRLRACARAGGPLAVGRGLRGGCGNCGFARSPDLAPGGWKRHSACRSRAQWAIAAGAVSRHSGEVRRRRARDRRRACAWPRGAERAHGRDPGPSRRQNFSAQLARLSRVACRRGGSGPRHGVQRANRRRHFRARGTGAAVRIADRDRRARRLGERHLRLPRDSGRRPGLPFGRVGHAGPGRYGRSTSFSARSPASWRSSPIACSANDGDGRLLRPLAGRDPRGAHRGRGWRRSPGFFPISLAEAITITQRTLARRWNARACFRWFFS